MVYRWTVQVPEAGISRMGLGRWRVSCDPPLPYPVQSCRCHCGWYHRWSHSLMIWSLLLLKGIQEALWGVSEISRLTGECTALKSRCIVNNTSFILIHEFSGNISDHNGKMFNNQNASKSYWYLERTGERCVTWLLVSFSCIYWSVALSQLTVRSSTAVHKKHISYLSLHWRFHHVCLLFSTCTVKIHLSLLSVHSASCQCMATADSCVIYIFIILQNCKIDASMWALN